MNILFWNVNGNENSDLLATCLREHHVDIAVLAEHKGVDFSRFGGGGLDGYSAVDGPGGCEKIRLIVRKGIQLEIAREQDRHSVSRVEVNGESFILAGTHLPDKRSCPDSSDRLIEIRDLLRLVNETRAEYGCDNLVIIGDYNANPLDQELLQADGFNSVLFKDVIKRRPSRQRLGRRYEHLYNPVLLGISEDERSYGSYYTSGPACTLYWHCLDQVLVSRSLVDRVTKLSYLKSIGDMSLVTAVKPKREISDHLPLLVSISG